MARRALAQSAAVHAAHRVRLGGLPSPGQPLPLGEPRVEIQPVLGERPVGRGAAPPLDHADAQRRPGDQGQAVQGDSRPRLARKSRSFTGAAHPSTADRAGDPQPPRPRTQALRSFDRQWLIADSRVLDRPRPDLWASLQDGQIFLNQQSSHQIASGPAVVATHLLPDTHHFNGRGGRILPLLHPDGSPNLAPGLLRHLARSLDLERATASDLAAYVVGVTGHCAFTERFVEELLTPGVRVPLTRSTILWSRAVTLGRELLWASTYGERCADPAFGRMAGAVEFPRGDERQVRYLTPIGRRIPDALTYDAGARTLRIGDGTFAPVPEAVWCYDVGGMKIVSKWFGYRKSKPASKRTSPLDDIHADQWPHEWTTELVELLSVLRRITDLAAAQGELLAEILAGPVITETELTAVGVLPVPASAGKARHAAADALFGGPEPT